MSVAYKTSVDEGCVPAETTSREVHRFSVDQYHRMIDAGILGPNDRVELLEGWVVDKMSRKPPHNGSIARITKRLVRKVPDEWVVRVQSAITLRDSEPEPDFAIVAGPEEIYFKRHPVASDIAVLMEVADSTLLGDRLSKGPLYAQARIPEYWIINLVQKQVEVYTSPRSGRDPGYRKKKVYSVDDSVPLILGEKRVAVFQVKDLISP